MHSKDPLASHGGICGLSIPLHEAREGRRDPALFLVAFSNRPLAFQLVSFSSHSAATVPQALLVITAAELTTRLPVQPTATVLPGLLCREFLCGCVHTDPALKVKGWGL
jgi:hypothetical protein